MTTYTLLVACCNLAARSAAGDPDLARGHHLSEAALQPHYHIIPCDRWDEARIRLGSHLP